MGRRVGRSVIAVNRRHPVLRVPSVAVVLLIAAALAAHWGLLPIGRGAVSPQPAEAAARGWHPPMALPSGPGRPARPAGPAAAVLTPVSAHGLDALASPGSGRNGRARNGWRRVGQPGDCGTGHCGALQRDPGRRVLAVLPQAGQPRRTHHHQPRRPDETTSRIAPHPESPRWEAGLWRDLATGAPCSPGLCRLSASPSR